MCTNDPSVTRMHLLPSHEAEKGNRRWVTCGSSLSQARLSLACHNLLKTWGSRYQPAGKACYKFCLPKKNVTETPITKSFIKGGKEIIGIENKKGEKWKLEILAVWRNSNADITKTQKTELWGKNTSLLLYNGSPFFILHIRCLNSSFT